MTKDLFELSELLPDIQETEHTVPVSGRIFKVQKVNDMIDA